MNDRIHTRLEGFCDLLHHWVRFWMHGGHVQRIIAIPDTQETGSLLETLRNDARNLQYLQSGPEAAILIAKAHDVQCRPLGNPHCRTIVSKSDRVGDPASDCFIAVW